MGMGAYDVVVFRGKRVDRMTRAALLQVERKLGYQLTVVQGSYNTGGVEASAGTHDGGGVVDLTAADWQRKVLALRQVGFAAWYRAERPGVWSAHIHAVLVGNRRLSQDALRQVEEYIDGFDGLAGFGRDPHTRAYVNVRFQYPPLKPTPNITEALKADTVEDRLVALRKVAESGSPAARDVASAYIVALENMVENRARRKRLHTKLAEMEVR
jgi:hypothetical protein